MTQLLRQLQLHRRQQLAVVRQLQLHMQLQLFMPWFMQKKYSRDEHSREHS